jgi:2-phosphosulfolactate phosphatase
VLAAHRQLDYALRFDWGLTGAEAILKNADVAIVVDVLSFTTAVRVAVDAGTDVLPY